MNFLAHLFLSFPDPDLQTGNFIADLIRNKEMQSFSTAIQKGILMHRFIDQFTDQHPAVSKSVRRLHPTARKYAPVVIDIFYDYLLAQNWSCYAADLSFDEFKTTSYGNLQKRSTELSEYLAHRLNLMIQDDWLEVYRTEEGIMQVMKRMDQRTRFPSAFELATEELLREKEVYNADFNLFFPDLMEEIALKNY